MVLFRLHCSFLFESHYLFQVHSHSHEKYKQMSTLPIHMLLRKSVITKAFELVETVLNLHCSIPTYSTGGIKTNGITPSGLLLSSSLLTLFVSPLKPLYRLVIINLDRAIRVELYRSGTVGLAFNSSNTNNQSHQ